MRYRQGTASDDFSEDLKLPIYIRFPEALKSSRSTGTKEQHLFQPQALNSTISLTDFSKTVPTTKWKLICRGIWLDEIILCVVSYKDVL